MLKRSWPRTSDTAIWASLIVAGPYFLALLPGACHLVLRCIAQQLESNNSVDLPRGPNSVVAYIYVSQLESLTSLTADVSKDYILLHVNGLIEVIFAARFIVETTF